MPVTKPVFVVHGGAWEIPDEEIQDYINGMRTALEKGWSILLRGGTALDAVEEAVVVMEDDPVFDAGKGSVLNTDGSIEMDASIMDGKRFDAGAAATSTGYTQENSWQSR